MLGERRRRRRRRMQVSYRRQMLKATFMFWFKLERACYPAYIYSFLHCLQSISKNGHVWDLTITIYSFLYYMGMNAPFHFFEMLPFLSSFLAGISQDKKKKKSLQVFMLHKAFRAIEALLE